MLKTENLSFRVESKFLLQNANLDFEEGRFHVIMGANGAGKSTLLKLLSGDIKPSAGSILMEGKELHTYSKKIPFG